MDANITFTPVKVVAFGSGQAVSGAVFWEVAFATLTKKISLAADSVLQNISPAKEFICDKFSNIPTTFNISVSDVFNTVVAAPVVEQALESPFLPLIAAGCILGIGSVLIEEMARNRDEKEVSSPTVKEAKSISNHPASGGRRSQRRSQKKRRLYHEKANFPVAQKNLSRQKPMIVHQPSSKGRGN